MSHRLTRDHILQLTELAAETGESWEEVLVHALSEYRGLVGVAPPAKDSRSLDAPDLNLWNASTGTTADLPS